MQFQCDGKMLWFQEHKDYEQLRCHAFVCDISDPESQLPFPDEVLDIVVCIFVLSAIHPDKYDTGLIPTQ
jgi:ubiquinone/menaquinone biosynthesis C-methylase UbiE